jgi:hypothetical protein
VKPLWKLRSGKFAGWNYNGQLYDAKGNHVGYFQGTVAVGCNGRVVGEMYDDKFIGYRTNISYPIYGAVGHYAGIAVAPYAGYAGYAVAGWADPHF